MQPLRLVVLSFLAFADSLRTHVHRHGGHLREYILCSNEDGSLYSYKVSQHDPNRPFTSCPVDIARIQYANSINQTGWALVDIEIANDKIPDFVQGYAAGFLEGRASRDLIGLHIANTVTSYCRGAEEYCKRLNRFLLNNFRFMKQQIAANPEDIYWRHVNVTINQLVGMINGFEDDLSGFLSDADIVGHPIYLLQIPWEVKDLEMKFHRPASLRKPWAANGHCSALVKINDANTDLLSSHITWDSYSSMLRVIKRYRFKLHDTPGTTYTFSGYPGTINSIDDFLLTSSQLAIWETTNENYNKDLMKLITHSQVPCWLRTQIATRLASSAREWAEIFALHNSGTYNNQWVIVDYKKFKPGMHKLSKGLVHIIELMPGHSREGDFSDILDKHRYWPSFNKPYFESIYKLSGTDKMAGKFGDFYSYERTPRHLIFKRDQHKVQDIDSMRTLMRYNDFKNDPLSRCNCSPPFSGDCSIAGRSDLNLPSGQYPFEDLSFKDLGATDVKITNVDLMKTLSFDAVSGPTHDPLPVFDWETSLLKDIVPHAGQPQQFKFKPLQHIWSQRSMYS